MTDYDVLWLPPPGVLFKEPETAKGLSVGVSCELTGLESALTGEIVPPPSVLSYECSATPELPNQLQIATSKAGVLVSSQDLSGLFPIVYIDCLREGNIERVYSWDELPVSAEEIIDYHPSRELQKEYTLTVRAYLSDGETVNAVYSLIILQDWTAGRDRLRSEMNVRSNESR